MKLIYAIGNTASSYLNYCLIKKNILAVFPDWQIKSYGSVKNKYYRFGLSENIDWCQESLHYDVGKRNECRNRIGEYYFLHNERNFNLLINQIIQYEPDLILNDMNYDFACLAEMLAVQYWYTSPLVDLLQASGALYTYRDKLKFFPKADNYINYHILGEVNPYILSKTDDDFSICFTDGQEDSIEKLIGSYDRNLSNNTFINSSSLLISSLISNNSSIIINQHLNNVEDQVNYYLFKDKLEIIDNFENCNSEKYNKIKYLQKNNHKYTFINNKPYLHELLEKYEKNRI